MNEQPIIENPCVGVLWGMDLQIERDRCYCPNHGVFEEDHAKHLVGRIVFKESKGYREGLCPKCK